MKNTNKKVLEIFIDESGDFGCISGCSELYIVAFVLHERDNSIINEQNYLNNKLEKLGFKGMIHSSLLVSNRNEYMNISPKIRDKIFWSLINFTNKINIKVKTIIVNKKYLNNKEQLILKLKNEIIKFFDSYKYYFESFGDVIIYYDNGQKILTKIIDDIIKDIPNFIKIVKFDQVQKRLFQISDMLTLIDKLNYKLKKKKQFTKAEKLFFTEIDIRIIQKLLRKKRL